MAEKVVVMEEVKLAIKTRDTLGISLLENLQGDLKVLSAENYEKLKREILVDGFSFAVHVWENPVDGKIYITDGHQRVATLKKMSEEGYKIPQVPVVFIEADDLNHAKRKVLAAASQYGKFDQSGAEKFIQTIEGIDHAYLTTHFSMPDISFDDLSLDKIIVDGYERSANSFKETEFPDLENKEESEFKQITFILHKDQLSDLNLAMSLAKKLPDLETKNENSNGNTIHKIVKYLLTNYE